MKSAGSIYGRTSDEWEEMREAAERFLVSIAKNRGMTDYSSLNRAISEQTGYRPFDYGQESERAAIGRLLGEISLKTNEQHGVMLSALVTCGFLQAGGRAREDAKETNKRRQARGTRTPDPRSAPALRSLTSAPAP
jgi:hypothetical protein